MLPPKHLVDIQNSHERQQARLIQPVQAWNEVYQGIPNTSFNHIDDSKQLISIVDSANHIDNSNSFITSQIISIVDSTNPLNNIRILQSIVDSKNPNDFTITEPNGVRRSELLAAVKRHNDENQGTNFLLDEIAASILILGGPNLDQPEELLHSMLIERCQSEEGTWCVITTIIDSDPKKETPIIDDIVRYLKRRDQQNAKGQATLEVQTAATQNTLIDEPVKTEAAVPLTVSVAQPSSELQLVEELVQIQLEEPIEETPPESAPKPEFNEELGMDFVTPKEADLIFRYEAALNSIRDHVREKWLSIFESQPLNAVETTLDSLKEVSLRDHAYPLNRRLTIPIQNGFYAEPTDAQSTPLFSDESAHISGNVQTDTAYVGGNLQRVHAPRTSCHLDVTNFPGNRFHIRIDRLDRIINNPAYSALDLALLTDGRLLNNSPSVSRILDDRVEKVTPPEAQLIETSLNRYRERFRQDFDQIQGSAILVVNDPESIINRGRHPESKALNQDYSYVRYILERVFLPFIVDTENNVTGWITLVSRVEYQPTRPEVSVLDSISSVTDSYTQDYLQQR